MKRTILFFLLVSCAITLVSAQGNNRPGQERFPRGQPQGQNRMRGNGPQTPESVNINGNLTLVRGMIAVKTGDITYLADGLNRFVNFIDGLKEGAAVTLEGNAFSFPQNEKIKFLQVQKLTLSGKEYDLGRPRPNIALNLMRNRQNQMYQRQHPSQQGCPCVENWLHNQQRQPRRR